MAKISEYPAASKFDSGDVLIKDGSEGTKKITASDAAIEFAGLVSSVNHRNVYRGKFLGSSVTDSQKAAIQNGTFDDLFIGDYWTIGGVNWIIADMDYWLGCGDTEFTSHHLVVVPGKSLYSAKMNDTNTTEGGYVGSKMYTANLETAKTTIQAAFGNLVLTHRERLVNAVSNGKPSGYSWYDSSVELPNEIMMYGCPIFTPGNDGSTVPTLYTIDKTQLALFRLYPRAIFDRSVSCWLRDVVSGTYFALVSYNGTAGCHDASASAGVRPVFPIG